MKLHTQWYLHGGLPLFTHGAAASVSIARFTGEVKISRTETVEHRDDRRA
jgi:hypothetical protein